MFQRQLYTGRFLPRRLPAALPSSLSGCSAIWHNPNVRRDALPVRWTPIYRFSTERALLRPNRMTWILRTLDPAKLTPQCYHDLSGKSEAMIYFTHHDAESVASGHPVFFNDCKIRHSPSKKSEFPPGTAGFLYYKKPPPGAPPGAGEIRFRVTQNPDPASFASGKDLLHHGVPWADPLFPPDRSVRRFFPQLLHDNLLSREELDRMCYSARAAAPRSGNSQMCWRLVYAYGQPFTMTIRSTVLGKHLTKIRVRLLGEDGAGQVQIAFGNALGYFLASSGQFRRFSSDTENLVVHFESKTHMNEPIRKSHREAYHKPKLVVRIREVLRADWSAVVPGEHPDADAVGTLLSIDDAISGPIVWYRILDNIRSARQLAPLQLLRNMPEGAFD